MDTQDTDCDTTKHHIAQPSMCTSLPRPANLISVTCSSSELQSAYRYRTFSHSRNTVHPVGVQLADTMPVDGGSVQVLKIILDGNVCSLINDGIPAQDAIVGERMIRL